MAQELIPEKKVNAIIKVLGTILRILLFIKKEKK